MNLTKSEALKALESGKKVTREYFGKDEYIFIGKSGSITSEDGYNFDDWWNNIEPTIGRTSDKCWSLYHGELTE